MNERQYETKLKIKLGNMFPGCLIMKNDASVRQGIPDMLILYRNTWAMLEVKMEDDSPRQANQEHYIERFSNMSFASFINPGNEEEVLHALQSAFEHAGQACVSKP